jgi:hypothetical protein
MGYQEALFHAMSLRATSALHALRSLQRGASERSNLTKNFLEIGQEVAHLHLSQVHV